MKSNKKLVVAGCAVAALTLSTVVMVSMNKGESEGKLTNNNFPSLEKTKTGKREKPHTAQEIRTVYEAIKENNIKPFEKYLKEGGSLNAVVDNGKEKMTLADVIVKHERIEFIKKAAEVAAEESTLTMSEYKHEAKEMKLGNLKSQLAEVDSQAMIAATAGSLAPILQAVAKAGSPQFKKDVLGLSKGNADVVKAVEAAASTVLPEAVSTCDQDQISFLGDLGANPMSNNHEGKNALTAAGKSKCFKAISYWKKEQNFDFDKKDENGISGFDVLSKFKDPELQSFTDNLQDETVKEIESLKPKVKRVSFYKKRVPSAIIDPEALVEPELRPDEATETAEFSEFSD